jgi:Asp-tRNA(Asn)/Glu-tRNA(Gln) amidotransferase C subunit
MMMMPSGGGKSMEAHGFTSADVERLANLSYLNPPAERMDSLKHDIANILLAGALLLCIFFVHAWSNPSSTHPIHRHRSTNAPSRAPTDAVNQIQSVDTSNVEPLISVLEHNKLKQRVDKSPEGKYAEEETGRRQSIPPLLANATKRHSAYFVVPKQKQQPWEDH